jgi:small subunit ribosomal protein S13
MHIVPTNKSSLGQFLKKSYGLSLNKGTFISKFLGFNSRLGLEKKLSGKNVNSVKKTVSSLFFDSALKDFVRSAIIFLIKIKSYRGIRHKSKYPARGQRTHTNGKTKKKFRY